LAKDGLVTTAPAVEPLGGNMLRIAVRSGDRTFPFAAEAAQFERWLQLELFRCRRRRAGRRVHPLRKLQR